MENKKYKVIHDRPSCIGCGACASVLPEYWDMNADGKSDLKGAVDKGYEQVLDNLDEHYEENLDAAKCCPVNCIHLNKINDDDYEEKVI